MPSTDSSTSEEPAAANSPSSSVAPTYGNKRFFSDHAKDAALNNTRKEYSLALAGAIWLKSEKDAGKVVTKASQRHLAFRELIGDRAIKVARKADPPAANALLDDAAVEMRHDRDGEAEETLAVVGTPPTSTPGINPPLATEARRALDYTVNTVK